MNPLLKGRVGFAVGTGRCGTTFLAEVAKREPHVASTHQRNDLNEAFHRYCKWNGLAVDHEGFLATQEATILADLVDREYSFESSGYLSFSIQELYDRFQARFVLLIRQPDKMVNSYVRKGWYAEPFICADPDLPLGFQRGEHFHHFLGRIAPRGREFLTWNQMTRVGKLAWYWRAVNEAVLKQFEKIPDAGRTVRLEDLDHAKYGDLSRFLGFEPTLPKGEYDAIVARKPNARKDVPTVARWNAKEAAEFESQVAPLAERLGYEFRVERLRERAAEVANTAEAIPAKAVKPSAGSLRRWLARNRRAA